MVLPLPVAWPGGRPVLVEPRTGGCRGMPKGHQGQAVEPTKSAMRSRLLTLGRLGAGLVGGACGWGSGMPAPSGQIPPLHRERVHMQAVGAGDRIRDRASL